MHTKVSLKGGKTLYVSKVINEVYIGIGSSKEIPEFDEMVKVTSDVIKDIIKTLEFYDSIR